MKSISVIVQREDGNIPGTDIIDPLICSENVALERGTQYIDANHKSKTILSTNGPYHTWMSPGSLVEIVDSDMAAYKVILTGIGIEIQKSDSGFTCDQNCTFEKVA